MPHLKIWDYCILTEAGVLLTCYEKGKINTDILKVGVMHCYQCKSIPVRMQAKEKNRKIFSEVWNSKIKLDTANMAKCSHALFSAICGTCKLFSLLRHNV